MNVAFWDFTNPQGLVIRFVCTEILFEKFRRNEMKLFGINLTFLFRFALFCSD